jgi:uncharacterized protein (DUF1330 family)
MPAYMIARAAVFDAEGMQKYRDQVPAAAAKYGGRFLVRAPSIVLEGDDDGRHTVVLEFPDMENLKAFWNGAEYTALRALRQNYSNVVAVAADAYDPPAA